MVVAFWMVLRGYLYSLQSVFFQGDDTTSCFSVSETNGVFADADATLELSHPLDVRNWLLGGAGSSLTSAPNGRLRSGRVGLNSS